MSNSLEKSDLTGRLNRERAANLKRGYPAIIVGIAAFLLLLYSLIIARPRIQSRYRQNCEKAMAELGMIPRSSDGFTNSENKLSPESQRDQINLVNLYLKRLISIQPTDELSRLQTGHVAEFSSRAYARQSIVARTTGDIKKAESLYSLGNADRKRAKEIMETLSQNDSSVAIQAKIWILLRALESPIHDLGHLDQLAAKASAILDEVPSNRLAMGGLGRVRLQEAYSLASEIDHQTRANYAIEAKDLFSKIDSPSCVEQAYLAEALDAINVDESIQIAIRATQAYWSEASGDKPTPELLSAMFGSLLRLGNIQEAQSLVFDNFASMAPDEQTTLRGFSVDVCLRNIACQCEFPSLARRVTIADVLNLAVRLDAGATSVLKLLGRLVKEKESDTIAESVNKILQESESLGLKHMIAATRAALNEDWPNSRKELQLSIQNDKSFGDVGGLLAMSLVEDNVASVAFGIRYFDQLARVSPDPMNLWFTKAIFCEKHGELEIAVECLERIQEYAPKHPKILDFLESLYGRLGKSDDVVRIQSLKTEFRKSKL